MLPLPISHLRAGIFLSMALLATAWAGPTMSVADQKGRSIDIELVSLSGDSVTFLRGGKQYTLPLDQFDASSQTKIREQAKTLPTVTASTFPKIEADVVIGKRRRKADSYYMEKQEVTSTLKLTNTSPKDAVPTTKGKILYIGQYQKSPELFMVLSVQNFEMQLEPKKAFTKEMETFVTAYDSDNKGTGNVGGFQYYGYILLIQDDKGDIVFNQTTTGTIRQVIANNVGILKKSWGYKNLQVLDKQMEPSNASVTYYK